VHDEHFAGIELIARLASVEKDPEKLRAIRDEINRLLPLLRNSGNGTRRPSKSRAVKPWKGKGK